MNIKRNSLFYFFIIVIVAFMAYSNTFQVPFQFDDDPNITENPLIKNMGY